MNKELEWVKNLIQDQDLWLIKTLYNFTMATLLVK